MVIAQIKNSQEGLSLALFWGIRLSVISLALNPLLYGLLARQYRMAYLYVLRRLLFLCCPGCVNPPPKDIFGECSVICSTVRTYICICCTCTCIHIHSKMKILMHHCAHCVVFLHTYICMQIHVHGIITSTIHCMLMLCFYPYTYMYTHISMWSCFLYKCI